MINTDICPAAAHSGDDFLLLKYSCGMTDSLSAETKLLTKFLLGRQFVTGIQISVFNFLHHPVND